MRFIYFQQMKQNVFLESSLKLSQIQARLTKNSYLSEENLPSHADAKVFLLIEKLKKTPDRRKHPQLYHWFIIMKQFAKRTLEMWIQSSQGTEEEDQLISDFMFEMNRQASVKIKQISEKPHKNQQESKTVSSSSEQSGNTAMNTPKNTQKRKSNQNYIDFNENNYSSLKQSASCRERQATSLSRERTPLNIISKNNQICSPNLVSQFIMEMQLNIEKQFSSEVIRERLIKEKVQLLSFEVEDEIHLRVIYKIDKNQCEGLKDRISKWSQVSNIRFRKERKMGNKMDIKSQSSISPIRKLPYS